MEQAASARELPPRQVGAPTVVVHPPFRWQRDYARGFVDGHRPDRSSETEVVVRGGEHVPVAGAAAARSWRTLPRWDLPELDYAATTLDLSHTAVVRLGRAGDGRRRWATGWPTCTSPTARVDKDEHLVPGRGNQPCAEVLERLARRGFTGTVVGRDQHPRAVNRDEREADLAEGLAFARLNLASASPS